MSKVFEDLKQEGVWKIMLDGFPRRLDQAKAFEALVSLLLSNLNR